MSNIEKTEKSEKFKALKLTMDKIDKDFGKGSVMMMNEKAHVEQGVISTGSIGLDMALGQLRALQLEVLFVHMS